MKFVSMQFGYMFFVLAGLIAVYIFAQRRRNSLLKNFAEESVLVKLTESFSKKAHSIKVLLIISAVFFSILALLRPQWGFTWEEVSHRGVDFFVAVDVSKSMLTRDVLPDRLSRAKLALEDLVSQLEGDRVGLIAFAGSAFVQCPLTIDYGGFLLAVNELSTEVIPAAGTNIENAIAEAQKSFGSGSQGIDRALVIITDGEDHQGDAVAAAKKASGEKIKIYTIGVGTAEGDLISITNEDGSHAFLKDSEGLAVKSRLNEKLLQEIALASDGSYVRATSTQFGLESIYKNKISEMKESMMASKMEKRFVERFQVPLFLAVLLLFLEAFIVTRKRI